MKNKSCPPVPTDLSTTRGIIVALGGPKAVQAHRSCTPAAISNWHSLGFPRSVEGDLIELAKLRGVDGITVSVLREASAKAAAEATRGRRGRPCKPAAPAQETK